MSKEPNRVDAGVPTGGQFAKTAHSDAVPSLTAASADPLDALDAARLRIKAQKQYLAAQEEALKASTDRIAGASAAAELLKRFPTAAKATYSRNLFNQMTFLELFDHEGTLLINSDRVAGAGRYDPSVVKERFAIYAAMRHLNDVDLETLKTQGVKAGHNKEILDLQAAVDSVHAGLDVESAVESEHARASIIALATGRTAEAEDETPAASAYRRAEAALAAATDSGEDVGTAIADLFTDVRLLADKHGVDIHEALDRSYQYYLEEKQDPSFQPTD